MPSELVTVGLGVFGVVTGLLAAQFLFPRWYSKNFNKMDLAEGVGEFYARQAGLAIAIQGAFLVWAAFDPSLRHAAAVLVGTGKLIFVGTILLNLKRFPGLLVSAVVDTVAVLFLAAVLLGA